MLPRRQFLMRLMVRLSVRLAVRLVVRLVVRLSGLSGLLIRRQQGPINTVFVGLCGA